METLMLQTLLGEGENDFLVYAFADGGSIVVLLSPEYVIPVAAKGRMSHWTIMDRHGEHNLAKGAVIIPTWVAEMYQAAMHTASCTGHYFIEERDQLNRVLSGFGLTVGGTNDAPFLGKYDRTGGAGDRVTVRADRTEEAGFSV